MGHRRSTRPVAADNDAGLIGIGYEDAVRPLVLIVQHQGARLSATGPSPAWVKAAPTPSERTSDTGQARLTGSRPAHPRAGIGNRRGPVPTRIDLPSCPLSLPSDMLNVRPKVRTGEVMEQDEAGVVRALFDAFNEGELDKAAATVSDDFELVDMAAGQTFRGPAGCREWLSTFRTAMPDAQTKLVNILTDGTRVATEHIGSGTHDGPFITPAGTIPATGRSVELRFAELYEVREGKITYLRAYYDSATLMRQFGLLPHSGSAAERAMTSLMALGVRAKRRVPGARR